MVLQFEEDVFLEGHDEVEFLDRLSSEGDFWHFPATPTSTDLDHEESAHHHWAAIGAMGQGSPSIPIGGTSPPAGYESVANAWQWEYYPAPMPHPHQNEWHITKPEWVWSLNPARWVWDQMHRGHREDDMRKSLAAIGADARFAELCLSRITWLQQHHGCKTAPRRLTKWTRNSKDEVWALHMLRAPGPLDEVCALHALRAPGAFHGRPMAIEGCMNMLLSTPVASGLVKDNDGDVQKVQYVSTFMEPSHITLSNIIYILIM